MSGIVSAIADQTALGDVRLALAGISSLGSFLIGASCSAILVNWGRRRGLHSQFMLPLLVEAALLLLFGLLGSHLALGNFFVPVTVTLLCFIMGLQNATITKLSGAEIRTTHMTGIVTDLGIGSGSCSTGTGRRSMSTRMRWSPTARNCGFTRRCSRRSSSAVPAGAIGFKHVGYVSTVPLAAVLVTLAIVPVIDDLLALLRNRR